MRIREGHGLLSFVVVLISIPIIVNDRLGDRGAEFGHPFGKPLRNAATVKS